MTPAVAMGVPPHVGFCSLRQPLQSALWAGRPALRQPKVWIHFLRLWRAIELQRARELLEERKQERGAQVDLGACRHRDLMAGLIETEGRKISGRVLGGFLSQGFGILGRRVKGTAAGKREGIACGGKSRGRAKGGDFQNCEAAALLTLSKEPRGKLSHQGRNCILP